MSPSEPNDNSRPHGTTISVTMRRELAKIIEDNGRLANRFCDCCREKFLSDGKPCVFWNGTGTMSPWCSQCIMNETRCEGGEPADQFDTVGMDKQPQTTGMDSTLEHGNHAVRREEGRCTIPSHDGDQPAQIGEAGEQELGDRLIEDGNSITLNDGSVRHRTELDDGPLRAGCQSYRVKGTHCRHIEELGKILQATGSGPSAASLESWAAKFRGLNNGHVARPNEEDDSDAVAVMTSALRGLAPDPTTGRKDGSQTDSHAASSQSTPTADIQPQPAPSATSLNFSPKVLAAYSRIGRPRIGKTLCQEALKRHTKAEIIEEKGEIVLQPCKECQESAIPRMCVLWNHPDSPSQEVCGECMRRGKKCSLFATPTDNNARGTADGGAGQNASRTTRRAARNNDMSSENDSDEYDPAARRLKRQRRGYYRAHDKGKTAHKARDSRTLTRATTRTARAANKTRPTQRSRTKASTPGPTPVRFQTAQQRKHNLIRDILKNGSPLEPGCQICATRDLVCVRWDGPSTRSAKCASCVRLKQLCSLDRRLEASEAVRNALDDTCSELSTVDTEWVRYDEQTLRTTGEDTILSEETVRPTGIFEEDPGAMEGIGLQHITANEEQSREHRSVRSSVSGYHTAMGWIEDPDESLEAFNAYTTTDAVDEHMPQPEEESSSQGTLQADTHGKMENDYEPKAYSHSSYTRPALSTERDGSSAAPPTGSHDGQNAPEKKEARQKRLEQEVQAARSEIERFKRENEEISRMLSELGGGVALQSGGMEGIQEESSRGSLGR